jgi:hypothetical protein
MKPLLFGAVCCFFLSACGGGNGSSSESLLPMSAQTVLFSQGSLDSVAGVVQSSGKTDIVSFDNLNRPVVRIYHLSPDVMWDQPTSQSLTPLTTITSTGNVTSKQISVDPQRADATAVQVEGPQIAFINNAEITSRVEPVIAPIDYEYRWALDVAPFPWRNGSALTLSLNLKVPVARLAPGNVAYTQTVLLVRDSLSGKFIFHAGGLFDSRPDAPPFGVQLDGCQQCSGLPIVGGPINNSGGFFSACPGTAQFTSTVFSDNRRFSYAVTADQWTAVISRLKRDFPVQTSAMSDSPSDYQLFEVALLNEISKSAPGAALLVTSFDGLTVSMGRACE